jgi:hypothetical protein
MSLKEERKRKNSHFRSKWHMESRRVKQLKRLDSYFEARYSRVDKMKNLH